MTIKYFANVHDLDELKKSYLQAMKKHHPDNGGDAEACKQINAEYDYLAKILPTGKTSDGANGAAVSGSAKFDASEAVRKILEAVAGFQNINVEIVGSWIWIDGATFPIKDELKRLGFRWSNNRKKWHWSANEGGFRRGCNKKFDELRATYGSTTIETGRVAFIA